MYKPQSKISKDLIAPKLISFSKVIVGRMEEGISSICTRIIQKLHVNQYRQISVTVLNEKSKKRY